MNIAVPNPPVNQASSSAISLQRLGYCAWSDDRIRSEFERAGAESLRDLAGEYVLILRGGAARTDVCIVSSAAGAINYYYATENGGFHHADTVLDVVRQSGMPWRWNWRALADTLQVDHPVGQDTLHPAVLRLPPASVLTWRSGRLNVATRQWDELYPVQPSTPRDALREFNQETVRWIAAPAVVSMSGGFDSRAILSSLLAAGCKPSFLTFGREEATDVVIARAIAAKLAAPIEVVSVDPMDYLQHAATITALSNGTKTAWHWHTYLYPKKASTNLSGSFFVGSNGEFARSFYFDRGTAARVANMAPPDVLLRRFWSIKLSRRVPADLRLFRPGLAQAFLPAGQRERVARIVEHSAANGFMDSLDRFYSQQRVRHFIGNGLRLYSESARWRAPFLSTRWSIAARGLSRKHKLGSNWHRYAIAQNFPELLAFPEQGGGPRMAQQAPALYWTGARRKTSVVRYADYPSWLASGVLHDYLADNAGKLEDLMPAEAVHAALQRHQQTRAETAYLSFLFTLIEWSQLVRSLPAPPVAHSQ